MRLTEIFLSIPSLLLIVFLQAILGRASVWSLSLVIGTHSRVTTRNTPGIRIIHHAPLSRAFSDRESIPPQLTVGSFRPVAALAGDTDTALSVEFQKGCGQQLRVVADIPVPQLITSSGSPMPIKLKVDSAAMAERTFITTMNMMEEKKFGARCFRRI